MALYVFLTLVILALVELVALFAFRVWEFRNGRVQYPEEDRKLIDLHGATRLLLGLERWITDVIHFHGKASLKRGGEYAQGFLTRYQVMEKLSSHRDLLKGKRRIIENSNPSAFWNALNERKDQLKDDEK